MESDEEPGNETIYINSPMGVMDTMESQDEDYDESMEPLIPPDSPQPRPQPAPPAEEPLDINIRRRPQVDLTFIAETGQRGVRNDPQIEPDIKIRKVLEDNQESFHSTDGHGEYYEAKLHDQKFTGVIRKLESHPTGSVIIYTLQFNNEQTWFNIGELINLELNGQSLLKYFFNILSIDFPNGGVFGLQAACETLIIEAKKISHMISTSDAVRYTTPYTSDDLYNYANDWITYLAGRAGEGDPYQSFYILNHNAYRVVSFSVILIPNYQAGGCNIGVSAPAGPLAACLILSEVDDNNCFFDALKNCANDLGITLDPEGIPNDSLIWNNLRVYLGIPIGYPIFFRDGFNKKLKLPENEHFKRICHHFEINVRIWSIEDIRKRKGDWGRQISVVAEYNRTDNPERHNDLSYVLKSGHHLNIFYQQRGRFGHFYGIRDMSIQLFKSCIKCSNWLNSSHDDTCENHFRRCIRCPICSCHMGPNHQDVCRGNTKPNADVVHRVQRPRYRNFKETWNQDVYFADFETFQHEGRQTVYSAALVSIDILSGYGNPDYILDKNKVHCEKYYGNFELFCEDISKMKGTCYFWFGCMFDFFFLVEYFVSKKVPILDLLKHGGKILTFRIGNMWFRDLWCFTMCSLRDGCKSFGVPAEYVKKDFDHTLIKDWNSAWEHKDLVVDYNKYDVICMVFIYTSYASEIREFNYNLPDAITLSHLAHELWLNTSLPEEVKKNLVLPDKDAYHFLHRALFGGRTMPFFPLWESSFTKMDAYKNWDNLDIEVRKQYMEYVKEYSNPPLYIDANSLYPSVCVRYSYPYGRYKWYSTDSDFTDYWRIFQDLESWDMRIDNRGRPRHYENSYAYKKLLRSFVEVDITCPTDILIPFLFHRDEKGNSVQNLLPKVQQVYDGRTLEEAYILGYRVTKIYRVLRYPKFAPILKNYMTDFHKRKQEAEANGQDAKRTIYKGALNNLTGKFSQKYDHRKATFIYDDSVFQDGNFVDIIKEMQFVLQNNQISSFLVFTQDPTEIDPNKQKQLGPCILANSRVWMSEITRAMGGEPGGSYLNHLYMPFYTDTDSLIIPSNAVEKMKPEHKAMYIGNELGQMKPEINGVIVNFCALAPKTYFYTYIDAKDLKLYAGIRTKGVPHNPQWCFRGKMDLEKIKSAPIKAINEDLRDVFYSLCERGEKKKGKVEKGIVLETKNYIPFEFFKRMYLENLVVVATFGQMVRQLISKKFIHTERGNHCVVEIYLGALRTINQSQWWNGDKRRMLIFYSVPEGHHQFYYNPFE